MFNIFGRVKQNIVDEMNQYEEKRVAEIEQSKKWQEVDAFLENLNTLATIVCPYKDPQYEFANFKEYRSLDEVNFITREGITSTEIIQITGLTSLRFAGTNWDSKRWEASYSEYKRLYGSDNMRNAKKVQSAIFAIHTNISKDKNDYTSFISQYSDTVTNVSGVIKEYGMSFITGDTELFNSVFNLIGSVVSEYENYTSAIREYKKSQALERIKMEQDFVNKRIQDNMLMLEFQQK